MLLSSGEGRTRQGPSASPSVPQSASASASASAKPSAASISGPICEANPLEDKPCNFKLSDALNQHPKPPDGVAHPESPPPQCGNACASDYDCGEPGDDCLCAPDPNSSLYKQLATSDIPVSASWGSMICQSFAEAVAASMVYSMTRPQARRRLMLEVNGSLAVTDDKPSGAQMDPSKADLGPLICPCNCTYVSPACCLSSNLTVYEDVSEKANLILFGKNGTCCDHVTGNWTTIDSTTSISTGVDFPNCRASSVQPSSTVPSSSPAASGRPSGTDRLPSSATGGTFGNINSRHRGR